MRKTRGQVRLWFVVMAAMVAGFGVAADRADAAVTATFSSGVLTVFGDGINNSIVISRDAAGRILVNDGAVVVVDVVATVVVIAVEIAVVSTSEPAVVDTAVVSSGGSVMIGVVECSSSHATATSTIAARTIQRELIAIAPPPARSAAAWCRAAPDRQRRTAMYRGRARGRPRSGRWPRRAESRT